MAAAFAAACSNPSSEGASDPAVDLLSELEPALLVPASGSESTVVSDAELTPALQGPSMATSAPRPHEAAAHVEHTAHLDDIHPEVVQSVATTPSQEVVTASAAGTSAEDEHAGHDHVDGDSAPGILIRGGSDIGIRGDPCIPGGHRPENGPGAGGGILGAIADASMLGSMGTMVNDETPRIGRGNLPYPRNDRSSAGRGGSSPGGMGGVGRVFIR